MLQTRVGPAARWMSAMLLGAALLGLAACGGSDGDGFSAPNSQAVVVTNSSLPSLLSGQSIDHMIPLQGGCGGPYVVEVIAGTMPRGIGLDDAVVNGIPRHHISGTALEDGTFNFRVQITDTSCSPFESDVVDFSWTISIGEVAIVGGAPGLIAPAQFASIPALAGSPYTDAHAFPVTVYNSLIAYDLIVAGGVAPYVAEVIDDPADPDDGILPLGLTMPAFSTSITGRPQEVLPGGLPFRLTIEVTDTVGNKARRKFLFKVDTPPLVQGTPTINDGEAGRNYSQLIQVAHGVPPFRYELIANPPTDINYDTTPPTVAATPPFTFATTGEASNRLAVAYPAASDTGPYEPYPSEGMFIVDTGGSAGTLSGIPRRVGTFTIHVHVHSAVVPNERGQHLIASYTHQISPSEALAVNPAFTEQGVDVGPPSYSTLPEFEVGQSYNPDSSSSPQPGLQLLATGGVPFDGYTDAAHGSERTVNPQEPAGQYAWAWNPDPLTIGTPTPPGIALFPGPAGAPYSIGDFGVTSVPDLQRQGPQIVQFSVVDNQLPTGVQQTSSLMATVSVGPDKVIIAESTESQTQLYTSYAYNKFYDYETRIRKAQIIGGSATVSDLDASDLSPGHTIPAATGLDSDDVEALLSDSSMDIVHTVINPTGWWNDLPNLNPKGARSMINSDPNQYVPYYTKYMYYEEENAHPAVDLPDCDSITHAPHLGVYGNGGRLYCFESASHFGVFVIREDASIYVPYAAAKSGPYKSFGDGMTEPMNYTYFHTILRAANMVVSPDGRFAAMKLKRALPGWNNHHENYTDSAMVVFTLTGEKMAAWGNQPYKVITSLGPALANTAPSTPNQVAYAPTMALTNGHLYFVIGNWNSSYYLGSFNSSSVYNYDHSSWRDHYIMRVTLEDGSTSASLLQSDGVNSNWSNTSSTPMQTPAQRWRYGANGGYAYNQTTYYSVDTSTTNAMPHEGQYVHNGWNMTNDSMAPLPFRASADGRSMAILAGLRTTATNGTSVMRHHVWVDVEGSGARQVSDTHVRSPMGGTRGYSLYAGPDWYPHWGIHNGPSTGFEIADNGSRVAVVTHENSWSTETQYYAYYSSSTYNTYPWAGSRNDIRAWHTSSDWATENSSGGESPVLDTEDYFGGAFLWRMGCLVFTADHQGLIWWAGFSQYDPTVGTGRRYATSTVGRQTPSQYQGTFYSYNFSSNTLQSIVSSTDGGRSAGIGTITTSSPYNPSYTNNSSTVGLIRPVTGFISRNRNFFYYCNLTADDTTPIGATNCKLFGINIASLSGSSINGHQPGRAFLLDNWPQQYGFLNSYVYYTYTFDYSSNYGARGASGQSRQVMAKDSGIVYFQGCYQNTGPVSAVSTSYNYYPTIAQYYGYGYYNSRVFGFDADVGGSIQHMTTHMPLPTTPTTTVGCGHWLITDRTGSRLAWQYSTYSTTIYRDRERLAGMWGLEWDDATGDLQPGHHAVDIEADSRLSDAMAFDSQGRRIYYGRGNGSGSGNENGMNLNDAELQPSGNVSTDSYTPTRRYSVLWAGR